MKLRTLAAAVVLAAAPVLLTTTQAFAATSHAPQGKAPWSVKWTPRHHKCKPCPPHCKPRPPHCKPKPCWHHEHNWGGMAYGEGHWGQGHDAYNEMAFAGML